MCGCTTFYLFICLLDIFIVSTLWQMWIMLWTFTYNFVWHMFSFLLGIYRSVSTIAGSYGNSSFNTFRHCQIVFQGGYSILTPSAVYEGPNVTIFSSTLVICLFYYSHPTGCEGYIIMVFLNMYFIDYAIAVVPFYPLYSPLPCTPPPPTFPTFSPCPWVIHISSLASPFPILFLTSPCLLSTYHLCYLFSVSFPAVSPSHFPTDNPPCDLHFCGSVSVLVVCLVFFCFGFSCGC